MPGAHNCRGCALKSVTRPKLTPLPPRLDCRSGRSNPREGKPSSKGDLIAPGLRRQPLSTSPAAPLKLGAEEAAASNPLFFEIKLSYYCSQSSSFILHGLTAGSVPRNADCVLGNLCARRKCRLPNLGSVLNCREDGRPPSPTTNKVTPLRISARMPARFGSGALWSSGFRQGKRPGSRFLSSSREWEGGVPLVSGATLERCRRDASSGDGEGA